MLLSLSSPQKHKYVYDRVKSALDDGRNVYQFDLTYTYEITFHEAYSVICDIRKDYWGIYVKEKLGGLEWYRKNNKLKPIYCPKCGVEMEHIESYERIMGMDVIVCRNYDCKCWFCHYCNEWHPYKTTCSVAMVHDMRNDSYESEIRELTSFFTI